MTTTELSITRDLLNRGKSTRGAWSKKQVECLGIEWPVEKGWAKRAIGQPISMEAAKKFTALKDAHVSAAQKAKKAKKAKASKKPKTAAALPEVCQDISAAVADFPRHKPSAAEAEAIAAGGFVVVNTHAGVMCESVLRTIYPMRELFTRAQIADAGYFIKRIGYERTCSIADWAAAKVTIKDGRYRVWMNVCRRHISQQQEGQS